MTINGWLLENSLQLRETSHVRLSESKQRKQLFGKGIKTKIKIETLTAERTKMQA